MGSPRDGEVNCSRKVVESQQGNAIVLEHEEVGSPSPIYVSANGRQSLPGFGIFKCKDKRCVTCFKYITEHSFQSSIIQKNYLMS